MEYTSAQRAFLRSSAQRLSPVVMVGKEGVTAAVAKALCDAADCHELVKVRFQAHKDEVKELSFFCILCHFLLPLYNLLPSYSPSSLCLYNIVENYFLQYL